MNNTIATEWTTPGPGSRQILGAIGFPRIWAVVLFNVVLTALLGGCSFGLEKATMQMMDEAETRWQAQSIQDYQMTVEVDRPDERRRITVTVAQGQIVQGVVSYWNPNSRRWEEPYELNQDQSHPFIVPGLFDMVREELKNSIRADIRVKMEGEPPFPHQIALGPVLLDGQPVSGTEATVIVKTYQPR